MVVVATEIEAVLKKYDGYYESAEVFITFQQIQSWYCGDGWYSDGKSFHMDYYNSMVIHLMMIDLCRNFPEPMTKKEREQVMEQAAHYVATQEWMISLDGTKCKIKKNCNACGKYSGRTIQAGRAIHSGMK